MDKKMNREDDYKYTILSLDYESQHFGIHPRTFIDIVYNQFWENLASSLNDFKAILMQEYTDVLSPNCIKLSTDELLQEFTRKLDECIDKLELYVFHNIMRIHPKAVLPEDEIHVSNPCTKEDEESIDREIEELKRKILEEKAKKQNLKKIVSEQHQVIKRLTKLCKELEEMIKTALGADMTKEKVETLYSDLDKLLTVISNKELFGKK